MTAKADTMMVEELSSSSSEGSGGSSSSEGSGAGGSSSLEGSGAGVESSPPLLEPPSSGQTYSTQSPYESESPLLSMLQSSQESIGP